MAGDWIKMRVDLQTHPKVVRIASALNADRLRAVGGLHAVWSIFDAHSEDGSLDGYTPAALDDLVGCLGFAQAMSAVGWLLIGEANLALPRFDDHNGQSAKRRAMETQRKRAERMAADGAGVCKLSPAHPDKKRTREEQRRVVVPPRGPRAGKPAPCPYDDIVALYHEALPSLPRVLLMPPKRERALRKTWAWVLTSTRVDGSRRAETAEQALEWLGNYFARASENEFLMGKTVRGAGHEGWTCDLDFLLTDKGMKHVIEKTELKA